MNEYSNLEKTLNIKFKNKAILDIAFVHRSYLNETEKDISESNERLEFLGDSILQFLTSDYLYKKYPKYTEGQLTNLRSKLVNTTSLAKEASRLKLHKYLMVSKGEKATSSESKHMLADTFEAVLGAIYLDMGLKKCIEFLTNELFYKTKEIVRKGVLKDHKSLYQEYTQDKYNMTPTYKVLKEQGPDHNKIFTVGLYLEDKLISRGTGNSKRDAQQDAAQKALETISR